jgi:hypothetical protein
MQPHEAAVSTARSADRAAAPLESHAVDLSLHLDLELGQALTKRRKLQGLDRHLWREGLPLVEPDVMK